MRRDDEMPGYDQQDANYSSPEFNTDREDDDYSNNSLDNESAGQDATYSADTEDDYDQDDFDESDVVEEDAVNNDISDLVSSSVNASQQPKGNPVYIKDMPPIDGAIRQGGI